MAIHFIKSIALFGLIVLSIAACTDSDEYLFNDQSIEKIKVSAAVTTAFDSNDEKSKTDTIQPGDSLIFLSTVYPSKSIRNRQYLWTIDGKLFANEFSFKKSIDIPGEHEIAFIFVDFFGDTLSDTLHITVASSPNLDPENFIPANGTQNIASDTAINFAWNASDPDSLWGIYSRFVLKNNNQDILVDTLLYQANYTYFKKLEPLQKYTWTVNVYNEFNQKSNETISSSFFTDGINGESAVAGAIGTSSDLGLYTFRIALLDSLQDTIKTYLSSKSQSAHFYFKPLTNDTYSLVASIDDAPDFRPQTIIFKTVANQVLELDSITLLDEVPPRIKSVSGSDTIDIQDTLRFILTDFGGNIPSSRISISYEKNRITKFTFSNDTLYIPFDKQASLQNWSYKLITLIAHDASNNPTRKTFYLRPNVTFPEVFSE